MRRLRVFTWHIHGNYLYYLTHAPHDFYIPVEPGRPGYGGRGTSFNWRDNLTEIPTHQVKDGDFDVILYQHERNWLHDQFDTLSPEQRSLPRIYLEHDPPRAHPTDTRHIVDDPNVLLVHVTPFNALMWDNGRTPTRIIEHGVTTPEGIRWTGELPRGIAVVNNLPSRGRRLGLDVFEEARKAVPLDLVGMGSAAVGGLGEIHPMRLAEFIAPYRFFFNPIRYTSMGLAVCEAMMLGMPVVALATTEMATVIENDVSGIADTDIARLTEAMKMLIDDQSEAARLGEGAHKFALDRFNIERFADDWDDAFRLVVGDKPREPVATAAHREEVTQP